MTGEAWTALGLVAGVFGVLATGRVSPPLALAGGLAIAVAGGLLEPSAALAGFSNEGLLTVAVLFVVAAGLRQTGVMAAVVGRALGPSRSVALAQMRLAAPVLAGSALVNNTPVVAMLMPAVVDWCRLTQTAASRMLLPLSYLAILGGLCTLIGTSTNLAVNGLLIASGRPGLGFFDIAWTGVPCALAGAAFLLLVGRRLLPDRTGGTRGAGPPEAPRREQAPLAVGIFAVMILLAATATTTMFHAALLAAAAMVAGRCCTLRGALEGVDWRILLAIGASFGLGRALEQTGAAEGLAGTLLEQVGANPWLALVVIYGTTTLLSELVTNNAAAVIVFPIAMATAAQYDVSHMPFVIAVMIAASASFATPLGYQTNLMVYGPGGYRLDDFLKVGLPMNLLLWLVTIVVTPLVWPM